MSAPTQTPAKTGPAGKTIVLLFAGLMMTMLMASLSQTILATALPTIVGELGGVDEMTWLITGYILASTVMMPVYGRISDLLGRKPVILTAIGLFIAGSIIGGLSTSIGMLVVSRIVQGLGGGGLMILSQSAIADVVPARDRGKYMGILGAVFAVSSVAGPLIGGWLTEGPGWRWAFWLNIPLGALAVLATVLFLRLPKVPRTEKPKIDYLGMVLIAVATTAVVLVCTWGGGTYPWISWQIIGLIAVAVVFGALFVLTESRAQVPVIPLSLFRDRNFTMSTIAGLLIGMAMFGVISYLPTYIQMVTGVSATDAGLLMIPMMAGLLVTSILSGALVSRTGRFKAYPVVGSLIMAVGLFLLSQMSVDTPLWLLCGFSMVFGAGLGLGQQILTLIVQNSFPGRIVGTATASFNYFKQVGATIGSAIVGAVFATRLTDLLMKNLAHLGGTAGGTDMHSLTPELVASLPDAIRNPIIHAYNEALLPILFWLIPVIALAFVVLLFVRQTHLATVVDRDRSGAETAEPGESAEEELAELVEEAAVSAAGTVGGEPTRP